MNRDNPLRRLPSIRKLQECDELAPLRERWSAEVVDAELRAVVDEARAALQAGKEPGDLAAAALATRIAARLATRLAPGVLACVNATGVVLHTGLGRAVLPAAALRALERELGGYSIVSVNREHGTRLRRETAIARLLAALTGAEAATIVNNNAAATIIALNTMAAGREAILSRGQLVEIGGSFRMPEIFRAAGVRLREVGTTNRTHGSDYHEAIGDETGLLLRVHPSNYAITGFASAVGIEELADIGRERGIPVMDDLGAGALLELPPEPEIATSLRAGADVVTCSGDKLIGGPQAGIILGKKTWIDRVRRNPLFRALRVDKMTLVALEATLRLFLRPRPAGTVPEGHPTLEMLRLDAKTLRRRATALKRRLARDVPTLATDLAAGFSQVGSGSLPGESLPTVLVRVAHPAMGASAFARALRLATPPVYTRIVDEAVCLDPRTLRPGDEQRLITALRDVG